MALFHIFLVAIIQGLTEFLPVSSSGHLILLSQVTPLPDQGLAIDVAGPVELDSIRALAYVRSRRYTELIDGQLVTDPTSDLGRVERQQRFLGAVMAEFGATRNPLTLLGALGAVADHVRGDIKVLEVEMPELSKHIVTRRHITPKTFENELAAFKGSAFSVAPKLTQSAYFRPSNKDSGIDGLYLVGAGTHPGAGLPGVLNSAKATVDLILSEN